MLPTIGNPIFAIRPADAQRELRNRTTLRRKSAKRLLVSGLQSKNAVKDIEELPDFEETLHVVFRGNFPLWSIVRATLALATPAVIESLSLATLGFSKSNATDLFSLIDGGQVQSVNAVCSVYFERQNPAEYKMMADGLSARGQRIVALRSHAKVIGMELSDGRRFVVESSANLRSCRNLEQLSFTQSPPLHDFHAGWIREVIEAAAGKKSK